MHGTQERHSISRADLAALCLSLYLATTLVSMATMNIGAAFMVLALLLVYRNRSDFRTSLRERLNDVWTRRYIRCSAFLLGACFLSLLVQALFPTTLGKTTIHVSLLKDMAKSWYFFVPLIQLLILVRLDSRQKATVIRGWLWAFILLSAIGLVQFFTGWPRPQAIPSPAGATHLRYHVTLFLGHHLSVASIWIFPFFYFADLAWRTADKWKRRTYALAATLGFIALMLTFARSLWGALPIGLVVWLTLSMRKRGFVLALLMIGLTALLASQSQNVRFRLGRAAYVGVQERIDLWEANWAFFKMRPIVGLGWRKASDLSGAYLQRKYQRDSVFAGHAHNNVIEMLASTGIIGTLAWLAWSLMVFGILVSRWKKNRHNSRGIWA